MLQRVVCIAPFNHATGFAMTESSVWAQPRLSNDGVYRVDLERLDACRMSSQPLVNTILLSLYGTSQREARRHSNRGQRGFVALQDTAFVYTPAAI